MVFGKIIVLNPNMKTGIYGKIVLFMRILGTFSTIVFLSPRFLYAKPENSVFRTVLISRSVSRFW